MAGFIQYAVASVASFMFSSDALSQDFVMPTVEGISLFEGSPSEVSEASQKLLEAGIEPKATITWSFGTSDPAAVNVLEKVLMDSCAACAQVPIRVPRCPRNGNNFNGLFLSYTTDAETLHGAMALMPDQHSSNALGGVALIIDDIDTDRQIEPRPRPCK